MRFLLALLTFLAGPAVAQPVTDPAQIALVCAYNSAIPAPTSGQYAFVQCDSAGKLITTSSGSSGLTIGTTTVTGASAGQFLYSDGTLLQASTVSSTAKSALANATNAASGLVALDGSSNLALAAGNLTLVSGKSISWNADLFLQRDAANTLALRNGTNAQTFNIYNTYTDASNYERLSIDWASNKARIEILVAGTGTARDLAIYGGGTETLRSTTSGNIILAPGGGAIQINGTTSAFPSLKASGSGATLQFRDATNSIDAPITAASISTSTAATFHTTSVALTNGAGAGAGTITNAPAAGNPTKWIGINDNGTTRYIPAW